MISVLARRVAAKIDPPLFWIVCGLLALGFATLYSAAHDAPGRAAAQAANILVAIAVMWVAAQFQPQTWMRYAIPAFFIVLLLLAAVALFGDMRNGARRWLSLGFGSLQPSELMKLAMPLMLARYFHVHQASLGLRQYARSEEHTSELQSPYEIVCRLPLVKKKK